MHMHSLQGRCLDEMFESPLALTAPSGQPRRGEIFLSISLGSICNVPIFSRGRNTQILYFSVYTVYLYLYIYILNHITHILHCATPYSIIHILPCALTKNSISNTVFILLLYIMYICIVDFLKFCIPFYCLFFPMSHFHSCYYCLLFVPP